MCSARLKVGLRSPFDRNWFISIIDCGFSLSIRLPVRPFVCHTRDPCPTVQHIEMPFASYDRAMLDRTFSDVAKLLVGVLAPLLKYFFN